MSLKIEVPDDDSIPTTPENNIKIDKVSPSENIVQNPDIVMLDIDNTLGDFGRFSILIRIWKHFDSSNSWPPINIAVDYLKTESFRPDLKEFFQNLENKLENNLIKKIGIFTSCNNYNGYIDYLVKCIVNYSEIKSETISQIITFEHQDNISRDGATIKDLNLALQDNVDISKVVIVDDKPYNVLQVMQGKEYQCIDVPNYINYSQSLSILEQAPWWDVTLANNIVKNNQPKLWDFNVNNEHEKDNTLLALKSIHRDLSIYPEITTSKETNSILMNVIRTLENRLIL